MIAREMYTFVHTVGKSVVDYVLVPLEHIIRLLIDRFKVGHQMVESDHRPLEITLNLRNVVTHYDHYNRGINNSGHGEAKKERRTIFK